MQPIARTAASVAAASTGSRVIVMLGPSCPPRDSSSGAGATGSTRLRKASYAHPVALDRISCRWTSTPGEVGLDLGGTT